MRFIAFLFSISTANKNLVIEDYPFFWTVVEFSWRCLFRCYILVFFVNENVSFQFWVKHQDFLKKIEKFIGCNIGYLVSENRIQLNWFEPGLRLVWGKTIFLLWRKGKQCSKSWKITLPYSPHYSLKSRFLSFRSSSPFHFHFLFLDKFSCKEANKAILQLCFSLEIVLINGK